MTWTWNTEPSLLLMLLGMAAIYRQLVLRLRVRLAPAEPFPLRESRWMLGGLALFYLAVGSPLDEMGERFLLSAHMVQHILLIFVLPIFIFKALPGWLLEPLLANRLLRPLLRLLLHPIVCLVGFNLLFAGWHIPGLYEWALRDNFVHEVEHITYIISGLWMWWPVYAPVASWRSGYGVQMLYAFGLSVSQIPVFFYLTFAPDVLFPTYKSAPRLLQMLTPQEDQVLGGILMKLVGEGFFIVIIVAALVRWRAEDLRASAIQPAGAGSGSETSL